MGSVVVRGVTTFVVPAAAVTDLPGIDLAALLVASDRNNSIRLVEDWPKDSGGGGTGIAGGALDGGGDSEPD
ncbi:MAG: hypothetical protein ACP5MD_11110 [Verrucomicrobiia bacterium]